MMVVAVVVRAALLSASVVVAFERILLQFLLVLLALCVLTPWFEKLVHRNCLITCVAVATTTTIATTATAAATAT